MQNWVPFRRYRGGLSLNSVPLSIRAKLDSSSKNDPRGHTDLSLSFDKCALTWNANKDRWLCAAKVRARRRASAKLQLTANRIKNAIFKRIYFSTLFLIHFSLLADVYLVSHIMSSMVRSPFSHVFTLCFSWITYESEVILRISIRKQSSLWGPLVIFANPAQIVLIPLCPIWYRDPTANDDLWRCISVASLHWIGLTAAGPAGATAVNAAVVFTIQYLLAGAFAPWDLVLRLSSPTRSKNLISRCEKWSIRRTETFRGYV